MKIQKKIENILLYNLIQSNTKSWKAAGNEDTNNAETHFGQHQFTLVSTDDTWLWEMKNKEMSPSAPIGSEWTWTLLEDSVVDDHEDDDGNDDGGEERMEDLVDHGKLEIVNIFFQDQTNRGNLQYFRNIENNSEAESR